MSASLQQGGGPLLTAAGNAVGAALLVLEPKQGQRARSLTDFMLLLAYTNLTAKEWAQAHGFKPQAVYDVLGGRVLGRRGESRRILQAMGVQPAAPLATREGRAA